MNLLDKMVIPQSLENLILLKYILTLALIIFLPFIGLLLISSIVSVIYSIIGRKQQNEDYLRFAKEIIDLIASKKGVIFVLGIVPAITMILAYSQLLHASKIYVEGYLLFAFLVLVASFILLMNFRYTFNLDEVMKFAGASREKGREIVQTPESERVARFTQSNLKTNRKSGVWGVVLLIIATYIIVSCIQLVYEPEKWSEKNSALSILLSLKPLVKYIYFILASIAISSGAALFYYFRFLNADPAESAYYNYIRKICVFSGIISVVLLPLFVLINLLMTPQSAVSLTLFTLTTLALILLFAVVHLFYILTKRWSSVYSAYIFYLLIIFFALLVINDQTSFSYSTKKQELALASNYDLIVEKAKEKAGKGHAISGKAIFDGRCSACHRFDSKLVGPAYKDVLPKYEGHRDQLIAFISNPVKKNPAFPPMPQQGLKPKEVEAIAEYIMKTYKQYVK